jgi:hypothetical protein
MRFKYVQTRVVRYVVVVEAESMDMADDFMLLHDEWQEDKVEAYDPPWREDCDPNEAPDLVITKDGTMLTAWDLRQMERAKEWEHPTKDEGSQKGE